MRQLPGRPSRRSASAIRRQSAALHVRCSGCGARSSRWRSHGAATPANERRLHLKSTATGMNARRCAPLVTLARVLQRVRHNDARVGPAVRQLTCGTLPQESATPVQTARRGPRSRHGGHRSAPWPQTPPAESSAGTRKRTRGGADRSEGSGAGSSPAGRGPRHPRQAATGRRTGRRHRAKNGTSVLSAVAKRSSEIGSPRRSAPPRTSRFAGARPSTPRPGTLGRRSARGHQQHPPSSPPLERVGTTAVQLPQASMNRRLC